MNGYTAQLRLRRPDSGAVMERAFAVSDAALARLLRLTLFALGALLLLLAPFAMAALTRPERGGPGAGWCSVGEGNFFGG